MKTILTDKRIASLMEAFTVKAYDGNVITTGPIQFARAIEQAVLQSPEIQRLREDAGRYRWLRNECFDPVVLDRLADEPPHKWDGIIDKFRAAMKEQP